MDAFRARAVGGALALATMAVVAGRLTPAHAAWDPVLRPAASGGASQVALAVGPGGRVAAAWTHEGRRSSPVRAVVQARDGTLTTRLLARERGHAVTGVTIVTDDYGETTVAWVDRASEAGLLHGRISLRATYRSRAGTWSAMQTVTALSPFAYAQPRLAADAHGNVALTFNAGVRAAPGVGIAWRAPGRPFGAVWPAPTGRGFLQEPQLVADPLGRLVLSGIASCGDEARSHGVLLTAKSFGGRLGAPVTIAPAPATHLRVAVTGPSTRMATWVRAGCSTSEDLSGAILAGSGGGKPAVLDPGPATGLILTGAPRGALQASWTSFASSASGQALTSLLVPGASPTAATPAGDRLVPVASDRSGDQLVVAAGQERPPGIAARPARTGAAVEPSPLGGPAWFPTAGTTRRDALAAARPTATALQIAVWRPTSA